MFYSKQISVSLTIGITFRKFDAMWKPHTVVGTALTHCSVLAE